MQKRTRSELKVGFSRVLRLSTGMAHSMTHLIEAAVLAHFLEAQTPATFSEVARRILGGGVSPSKIREHVFCGKTSLIVTKKVKETATTYSEVDALEPSAGQLKAVVAHISMVRAPAVRTRKATGGYNEPVVDRAPVARTPVKW